LSGLLDQLFRLQDRIRFVETRARERDTVPEELSDVDREYRERVDIVARIRERLVEAEADRRRAEAELEDHQEKQKKYQGVLRSVQSSREYGAVLNEIDGVEKQIRATEDRILSLDEELAAARSEIQDLEKQIPIRERAEFRRLVEKKGGLAIVRVVNASCSACHVKVRPAAMQILEAGREIVYCDSCKRMLHWDGVGV